MSKALPTKGRGSFMFRRSQSHWHRGIDLGAPDGSPLYAAEGGVVVHAKGVDPNALAHSYHPGFGGYGHVVVLKNDSGVYTLHGHLRDVTVSEGDTVRTGDLIAHTGTTAGSKASPTAKVGPHVHFEVSSTSYPQMSEAPRIDPVAWLREGRLHPLTRERFASEGVELQPFERDDPRAKQEPQSGRPFVRSSPSQRSVCPCCGQALPNEKSEAKP